MIRPGPRSLGSTVVHTAAGSPVLYDWARVGDGYALTVDGTRYELVRIVRPEVNGYGPAGEVSWQIEINGRWAGTDPFSTKRAAVDYVSDLVAR
jgi:hypothetical protein